MIDDHLECFHHLYAVGNYDTAYVVIQDCKEWLTLQGQYRLLIGIYQQLADVYQVPNSSNPESSQRLSVIFTGLSAAYWSLGEYRKSIDYQEQGLAIYREIDDRYGEASGLFNLAITCLKLAHHSRGREYFEQAKVIFTTLNMSHKAEKCDQANRKSNRVNPAIPKMAPTIGIRTPHSIKSSWTKWLSCVLITILVIGIILLVQ